MQLQKRTGANTQKWVIESNFAAGTTTTTTIPKEDIAFGDTNCNGSIDISDAVLIMQSIVNNDEYQISEQGKLNADVIDSDGITTKDALVIQLVLANVLTVDVLPISSAILALIVK